MGRQPLLEPVRRPDERLVTLLAEMLRSALSWEQEHGVSPKVAEGVAERALTGMPKGVHSVPSWPWKLRIMKGGKGNGFNSDSGQERPPADDI